MKHVKILIACSMVCTFFSLNFTSQTTPDPVLAKVQKRGDGYSYSQFKTALIKKNLGRGYVVTKSFIHHIDGKFYLGREIKNGKRKGTVYTEVRRRGDLLFPIPKPELYFACWQIASCQCERPSKYEKCSCNGYGANDGCTLADDIWNGIVEVIYHI